jgi:hypothetical protein
MASRIEETAAAREMITAALSQLSPWHRFLVCLAGIGFSLTEIAERLGCTRQNISREYVEALRQIRQWRIENEHPEGIEQSEITRGPIRGGNAEIEGIRVGDQAARPQRPHRLRSGQAAGRGFGWSGAIL